MPKWLSEHPFLAAVAAVVAFLCWSLPAWLGSVWPLFTAKTVPEWLAEQRWPVMGAAAFHWLTLGVGLVLVAFTIAIAANVRAARAGDGSRGIGSESLDIVAEARRTQVRRQITEKLRLIYSGSASSAIGGVLTQVEQTAGALRNQAPPDDRTRPLVSAMLGEMGRWTHDAIEPVLEAQRHDERDDSIPALLAAWGELFARYQLLVHYVAAIHRVFGVTPSVKDNWYTSWREWDERFVREMKLFEHMEGCERLAIRLKEVGWGEEDRPPKTASEKQVVWTRAASAPDGGS